MTRTCYVTSDLHVGDRGPLDDFCHDDVFAAWIDRIAGPDTVLVLNGDVIDFVQIPPLDLEPGLPSVLLWNQDQSLAKVGSAIDAHPVFFAALGRFCQAGGELRIVGGNHDLDMAWPRVRQTISAALGDPATLSFVVDRTEFAGVVIQHGHQATRENCPDNPSSFIHSTPNGAYLERVWGTDFVLEFFNSIHMKYEFANNVKPAVSLLIHGIRNRWLGWREFVRAIAFLARASIPGRAAVDAFLPGDDAHPEYLGLDDLFTDPEIAQIVRSAIGEIPADELADRSAALLTDELRRALAQAGPIELSAAQIGLGDDPTVSAAGADATLGIFRDSREIRAARDLVDQGARHVVFGHTHRIVDGDDLGNGALLFNPGTWIPFLDLRRDDVKARIAREGVTEALLGDASMYDTELRAVRVPESGRPELIELDTTH